MLTHNLLTWGKAMRTQNTHVNTVEKVKSSCEHVFHPRPETHRWNCNQQLSLSQLFSISIKGQNMILVKWPMLFPHRERQAFRRAGECDYTPESLCSPLLWRSQRIRPIGPALWVGSGTEEQPEIQCSPITGRQIHWATRTFNPINFYREGRLITFGSP